MTNLLKLFLSAAALLALVGCAAQQEAEIYQPAPSQQTYPSDQGGYYPSQQSGTYYPSQGGYQAPPSSSYGGGGSYQSQPSYSQGSSYSQGYSQSAPANCYDCGVVEHIEVIQDQGRATGLGAIAGAVGGGLLGGEIGHGTGRKIATVAGVAGGAYAGHQVEKRIDRSEAYLIHVRMSSGRVNSYKHDEAPQFGVGSQVRVVNNRVLPL